MNTGNSKKGERGSETMVRSTTDLTSYQSGTATTEECLIKTVIGKLRNFVVYSFALLLVLLAAFSAIWAADLTGRWKSSTKTPRGTVERAFVFKQEVNKLTGHILSPHGQKEPIKDGKVGRDEIEFSVERRQPGGGSGIVTYKGKVKGDKIKGTFVGPGGYAIEWTAIRENRPTP